MSGAIFNEPPWLISRDDREWLISIGIDADTENENGPAGGTSSEPGHEPEES